MQLAALLFLRLLSIKKTLHPSWLEAPCLSLHTISQLRDDEALVLYVADADQVPLLFAALFLSARPCFRLTIEVETMAVVGNPRVGAESLLN